MMSAKNTKPLVLNAREFYRGESGGGTAFGLFIFILLAMVFGLGLDFANAWRNRTYLSSTADIATHAGLNALANGATVAEARAEVANFVEFNMPNDMFGNVINAAADITFADYDVENRTFNSLSPSNPNAVIVEVYRTAARGNPVANNLMAFLGMDTFDMDAVSAGVYDWNGKCASTDGIYAHGQVTLTSQTDVGGGFCIHSESHVWLPQQNTFANNLANDDINSLVTMPNLALCEDKCEHDANPNIFAVEAHMVMGDFGTHIMNTIDTFMAPMGTSGEKYEWFHWDGTADDPDNSLGGDLAGLVATASSLSATPVLGQVVEMTRAEFQSLSNPPSGLVYVVECTAGGNGPNTTLTFDNAHMVLDGVVLLTNCTLFFDEMSDVRSSVVVTTRDLSTPSIEASENVVMGDPTVSCVSADRAYFMSMGSVKVPAKFGMSNVTLIVDDDVHFASASSAGHTSYGFVIYASGDVQVAAQHSFESCGDQGAWLTPEPKIIRLVEPPIGML